MFTKLALNHRGRPSSTFRNTILTTSWAVTLGLVLAGCTSAIGGEPRINQTAYVCESARTAIESLRQDGLSDATYQQVEVFLEAARSLPSDDVYLLYLASYVGDAHRGTNPQITLEPLLADVVAECSRTGL